MTDIVEGPQDSAQQAAAVPPVLALRRLIFGHRVTQIIAIAAQLGLADHLAAGPKSADELAALVQVDAPTLYRLLRALASVGVLAEVESGGFALTPLGDCLRTDAPNGMRSWALLEGEEFCQRLYGDLLWSVKTGGVTFDHAFGIGFYQYLMQHPDTLRLFSAAMAEFAALSTEAVAADYDFSPFRQIVDVGGGQGVLLTTILSRFPQAHGVLFELASVIERVRPSIEGAGLANRCELVAGDFFVSVPPGADAYILQRILHSFDDERSVRILHSCRCAMTPTSRVLIIQQVMPPPGAEVASEPLFHGVMSDLNMLAVGGGRERTEAEYRALLEAAGLKLTRVVPTQSLMSVVEGMHA
jgi:hypothetical protein